MKLSRNKIFISLFAAAICLSSNEMAGLVLWLSFALIFFSNRLRMSTFQHLGVFPYFLLLIVCTFSTMALSPFSFDLYFVMRDVFYFLSPIIMLLIGFYVGRSTSSLNETLWALVVTLSLLSIYIYKDAIISGAILSLSISTRYTFALDSSLVTLSLIIMIAAWRNDIQIGPPRTRNSLAVMALFFVIVSLSRINIAVVALTFLIVIFQARWIRYSATFSVLALIILPIAISGTELGSGNLVSSSSFLEKLASSLREVAVQDQIDFSGINLNWRGYEAFLGYEKVRTNGLSSVFAGLGFGSFVEGPFQDKLNFIPIFHNGYLTIYFKGGVIGLMLFFYFLKEQATPQIKIRKDTISETDRKHVMFLDTLAALIVLSIALRTASTHGIILPKVPLEILLLGMVHGARYRLAAQTQDVILARLPIADRRWPKKMV